LALKGLSGEIGMTLKMKVLSPDKIREGLAILNKKSCLPGSIFFKKENWLNWESWREWDGIKMKVLT
jgi:hypothetical protein